jgi:hypothetical protein
MCDGNLAPVDRRVMCDGNLAPVDWYMCDWVPVDLYICDGTLWFFRRHVCDTVVDAAGDTVSDTDTDAITDAHADTDPDTDADAVAHGYGFTVLRFYVVMTCDGVSIYTTFSFWGKPASWRARRGE